MRWSIESWGEYAGFGKLFYVLPRPRVIFGVGGKGDARGSRRVVIAWTRLASGGIAPVMHFEICDGRDALGKAIWLPCDADNSFLACASLALYRGRRPMEGARAYRVTRERLAALLLERHPQDVKDGKYPTEAGALWAFVHAPEIFERAPQEVIVPQNARGSECA